MTDIGIIKLYWNNPFRNTSIVTTYSLSLKGIEMEYLYTYLG